VITSDGASGAIVAWQDLRGADNDIYAQRVTSAGVAQWPSIGGNGTSVCLLADDQAAPAIAADGQGGAVISWTDRRTGSSTNHDIYVQRVSAAGATQWTTNGVGVTVVNTFDQISSAIVTDAAGQSIVIWDDNRSSGGTAYHIFGARVSGSGTVSESVSGGSSLISAGITDVTPVIVADGTGGAIIACASGLIGSPSAINGGRFTSGGSVPWTVTGVQLAGGYGSASQPAIVSDGLGGAVVSFTAGGNIYAQRVSNAGTVLWGTNGKAVSTAAGSQVASTLATDGAGGAVISWGDSRSGTNSDVYAQRIERFGEIGSPEPTPAGVLDIPNDQGGRVRVAWGASYLDLESNPDIAAYDLYHSVPTSAAQARMTRGAPSLDVRTGAPLRDREAILFAAQGIQILAWEFSGTVSLTHFLQTYGSTQATTSDSVSGSNPRTYFMVVARNSDGSKYWLSAPDSGYSVDNLAPTTPAALSGNYTSGATHLHWNPNPESDFLSYQLYRGTSPGFVPGPATLVGSPADTGYVDVGAAGGYYKLSALDVHGNESGYALLTPTSTTDVPVSGARALVFGQPVPNPSSQQASFALTLPRQGSVRLVIRDLAGRTVRSLVSEKLAAGTHEIRWDLRNAQGAAVADGVYFATLQVEERTLTRRILVAK
jgi:hypothetical protein